MEGPRLLPPRGLHCILEVRLMVADLGPEGPAPAGTCPAPGFPSAPRVQGPQAGRNSPSAGIPRAPRFAARGTCRASPGAELGGGRFPCASAVTSARGVPFPSRPAASLTLLAPEWEPGSLGWRWGVGEGGWWWIFLLPGSWGSESPGFLDERMAASMGCVASAGRWVPATPKSAGVGAGAWPLQIPGVPPGARGC